MSKDLDVFLKGIRQDGQATKRLRPGQHVGIPVYVDPSNPSDIKGMSESIPARRVPPHNQEKTKE